MSGEPHALDIRGLVALLDALSGLGEGGILVDGTQLVHANEAYRRLLGYDLAELRAFPSLLTLLAPEEMPRVKQRFLEQGLTVPAHERYETTLVAKSGARIPVELASVHIAGAPGTVVLSLVRDLRPAEEREKARRDSEEMFRRAFDDAAMGMALFDAVGGYVRVNRVFCDMVGYTEAEIVGRSYLELTFPEDAKPIYEVGHEFIAGRDPTLRFEKRYRHKDGHVVWAHVTSSAIRDSEGKPRFYVTQMLDITERKKAEEEARRQLVSKALVRLLLRDVAGGTANVRTRELGKRLVERAVQEGSQELEAYLDAFRALGAGTLTLETRAGDRFTFAGTELLETVAGSGQPTCHLTLGYLEGVVGAATSRRALGSEVACRSQGHAQCRFVVQARAD